MCSEGIKSIANIILVHHLKNCLACEVISYAAEQNMLVKRFQKHLWIYGFIILGARGVFPALRNMSATGTASMYIACLQSSLNREIRVLEEEHTNAAAIEPALFQVDCL